MWSRLVYGTAVILAIAGGTAVYYTPRPVIKPIDIIELVEGAHERLMPFGYTLATNTLVYVQSEWAVDPSTNRWQSGSNQLSYLTFVGLTSLSTQFINVAGIAIPRTTYGGWDAWDFGGLWFPSWDGPVPGKYNTWLSGDNQWQVDVVQTGRTLIDGQEYPAYVVDPHPIGVGTINSSAALAYVDAIISTVIPQYADHEKAVDGMFTNQFIPMLTVSSVWARLDLPFVWTNISKTVTNVPITWTNLFDGSSTITIGTNRDWMISTNITTNLTFTPGPIVTTNMLQERFKVLSYLRWTPGRVPGWTNSTLTMLTNSAAVHADQIYQYESPNPPPWDFTNFPAWWDFTEEAGPPGDFFEPTESDLIDDQVEPGEWDTALSTNLSSGVAPYKTFSTDGLFKKYQSLDIYKLEGSPGWVALFQLEFRDTFTTTVHYVKSSPSLLMPYNIAKIPVTGDVYLALSSPMPTNVVITSSMTGSQSNSYIWVGDVFTIENEDLFTSTNYQYGLVEEWWPTPHWWGVSWGAQADASVAAYRSVLKWSFSRCRL